MYQKRNQKRKKEGKFDGDQKDQHQGEKGTRRYVIFVLYLKNVLVNDLCLILEKKMDVHEEEPEEE